jgi:hypothetical protein|tara:strand:+ start:6097 stop:6321 length:225 start_codon:yes stop_codon:yes gene_type:complete
MNKPCRYLNKILSAQVSPVQKGYLLENSKVESYGYIMAMIKTMEGHPNMDEIECKLIMKENLKKRKNDKNGKNF